MRESAALLTDLGRQRRRGVGLAGSSPAAVGLRSGFQIPPARLPIFRCSLFDLGRRSHFQLRTLRLKLRRSFTISLSSAVSAATGASSGSSTASSAISAKRLRPRGATVVSCRSRISSSSASSSGWMLERVYFARDSPGRTEKSVAPARCPRSGHAWTCFGIRGWTSGRRVWLGRGRCFGETRAGAKRRRRRTSNPGIHGHGHGGGGNAGPGRPDPDPDPDVRPGPDPDPDVHCVRFDWAR